MFLHLKRDKMETIKKRVIRKLRPVIRPVREMAAGYPQYRPGNSRKNSSVPRVMVTGRNYSSNLCMARSLGMAGFEVEIMRVFSRRPSKDDVLSAMVPDAYSRYVKAFHSCVLNGSTLRGADALLAAADRDRKMLLIPTDDISALIIDESYDRLKAHYYMPNIGETQGEIIRLMSKGAQKDLADTCGLPMLKSSLVRSDGGRYEIPGSVTYPCFIKPDVSCRSSKKRMKKCSSEEELRAALDEISLTAEPDLLIEEFVDVEREISLLGLCIEGKVLCPGMIEATSGGHGARRGVAATGVSISPVDRNIISAGTMEKVCDFMRATGYDGLFDIDLIETGDGKQYFLEVNLRYGASGYVMTCNGINLPGIYAGHILCGHEVPGEEELLKNLPDGGKVTTFASEKVLLENYADGAITESELEEAIQLAEIHFVKDEEDMQPYRRFTEVLERIRKEKGRLNDKCIVFESLWGRRYSCNPAALYEYIDENHPEYECVWFLNDPDTPVKGKAKKVVRGTDEHKHYLATAKYFVFNNNMPRSFRKRDGQVIVQTMHGTPFKSFGLDVKEEAETEKQRLRVVERSDMWDYLIAQGRFTKEMAWQWFRYDKTILETGYPRTDALFAPDTETAEEIRRSLGLPADKKVILYAPTWREMDRFDMMLDIEAMRRQLSDSYVLLIRLHHFVSEFYTVPEDGEFVFDVGKTEKIEDLFAATDILITDYSSVMFDFALTGRPMIFFTYDLDEYTGEDRGSYFKIEEEAPGVLARTTEEVIDAVKDPAAHESISSGRVKAFMEKYLTYEDPHSCERVFDEVFVRKTHLRNMTVKDKAWAMSESILPHRIYRKMKRTSLKHRVR